MNQKLNLVKTFVYRSGNKWTAISDNGDKEVVDDVLMFNCSFIKRGNNRGVYGYASEKFNNKIQNIMNFNPTNWNFLVYKKKYNKPFFLINNGVKQPGILPVIKLTKDGLMMYHGLYELPNNILLQYLTDDYESEDEFEDEEEDPWETNEWVHDVEEDYDELET